MEMWEHRCLIAIYALIVEVLAGRITCLENGIQPTFGKAMPDVEQVGKTVALYY